MIKRNKNGQVFIALGEGTVLISKMQMGKYKCITFKHSDTKMKIDIPVDLSNRRPDTEDVYLAFKDNNAILRMIRDLSNLAILKPKKFPKKG